MTANNTADAADNTAAASTWKSRLSELMPADLAEEIDVFEQQIALRKEGKLDEAVFGETRLRRGVYGQRYDNGQRHDGTASRTLAFPSDDILKGPHTLWDAPGMMRIKIPYGDLTPDQLEVLAACAEEYADTIVHVTTRQDIQLHYVHIEDTPDMMRRLAAVGITTREACGNAVRNVTACHIAGVCPDEAFDVSPYAHALTYYLLGHPDTQGFGRKFKVAFSGCEGHACGLATIHDIGLIAATRTTDGKKERGFAMYVGGGLGAVPHEAQLFDAFVTEAELFPVSLAICRVFARLGAKRNRAKARLKFVLKKLGIEEFRRVVAEERTTLRDDPRWTDYLADVARYDEQPLKPASSLVRRAAAEPTPFDDWRATNVQAQKQAGYSMVTLALPLGDLSADQTRALATLARKFTRGTVRATVEQNLVMRWISDADLPELHTALDAVGLARPGAGTIVDVTSCPGTDTCKLGIAASRGLGGVLSERLAAKAMYRDEAVGNLRIKISGCFNSCGQHHVADIGFWGVSRKVAGYTVPHFQAVLGGQWSNNAKTYGLAMGAIPSRNVPQAVEVLVDHFVANREGDESYQAYIRRLGKPTIRKVLKPLMAVPAYEEDKSFYSDWGDPREFTIGDMGIGECAGEVVSAAQFGLAESERQVFEAQEYLEKDDLASAADHSYRAMLEAARAVTREISRNLGTDPEEIVRDFRSHMYDTKRFFDPFAGGKFGAYLFQAHEQNEKATPLDNAHVRQRIEEAQLFIEAAHSCYGRMVDEGISS